MSGARIIINTEGFSGEVRDLVARALNCSAPLKAWGVYMVGSVKQNFFAQGRPDPWKPLKVATLIARYMRNHPKAPRSAYKKLPSSVRAGEKVSNAALMLGDVSAVSSVAGFARSPKTGRVLRARHGGLNKFAPEGYVFRRPVVSAILTGKILMDKGASGGLLGSISSSLESNNRVAVGSNKVYAAAQNYGYAKSGIPARPFEIIQEPYDVDRFTELVSTWVLRGGTFS